MRRLISHVLPILLVVMLFCPAPVRAAPAQAQTTVSGNTANFKPDVIYQVLLDRFFDGNPANNDPPEARGLYDGSHKNWRLYWGGDLAGLTQKLSYLADMGITALWISPPVENIHRLTDHNEAGYHGYWARDFYRIDPHVGTWDDFATLVRTAHSKGIKVILDFAPNHTSPRETAEQGSLYRDGAFQAAYNNDPQNWFHHLPAIMDYNDPYQNVYYSLFNLADLAQENNGVDSYLKGAIAKFLQYGIDGIRLDAAKHLSEPGGGWSRTLSDAVNANAPHYLVGEWLMSGIDDPTYPAAASFANHSGINLLNFPLTTALRNVYGAGKNATELDAVLTREGRDLLWLNDQAVSIDNHDMPRFLSLNGSHDRLHQALAVTMTLPGIPIIYYGTEQYLHNDTDGGGDPYSRPMMTNFDTATMAYREIKLLAQLRHSNPALAYGSYQQRWLNNDVFIFERHFNQNVIVVAVNKSATPYTISNMQTRLPDGTYRDYLGSLLHGGTSLTVTNGAVSSFLLGANQVSIWQASADKGPAIGSVSPNLSRPGGQVVIDGQGFGSTPGTVKFGASNATVKSWSAQSITVTVPQVTSGLQMVQVCTSTCSNGYPTRVSTGPQTAVTFTVRNAPPTNPGDNVYLTGQFDELGNWDVKAAIGPLHTPKYPDWFVLAGVPACQKIELKFVIVRANGSVQWEKDPNHTYTTPCNGTGSFTVNWQN